MEYLMTGLILLTLGNLIALERTVAGMKKELQHIKRVICTKGEKK